MNAIHPTTQDFSKTYRLPYILRIETGGSENLACVDGIRAERSRESRETRRRHWSPLQLENPEFLENLKNRETTNRDFIMENIVRKTQCQVFLSRFSVLSLLYSYQLSSYHLKFLARNSN